MKIGFHIPLYSPMCPGTWITSLHDHGWAIQHGHLIVPLPIVACPVDRARNQAVARALAAECERLYMLDADTYADPTGSPLEALMGSMDDMGAFAVAGAVPLRQGTGLNCSPCEPNLVIESERVGAAMLLIDLVTLRAVMPDGPWFLTTLTADGLSVQESEDWYFSRRVLECGEKLLANCQIPSVHFSQVPLSMGTYLRMRDVTATAGAPTESPVQE